MTDSYDLPDEETLVRYLAVLRAVIVVTRHASDLGDAPLAARLMDAVHNLPDFLTRWSDFDEQMFWAGLRAVAEQSPSLEGWLQAIEAGQYASTFGAAQRR